MTPSPETRATPIRSRYFEEALEEVRASNLPKMMATMKTVQRAVETTQVFK